MYLSKQNARTRGLTLTKAVISKENSLYFCIQTLAGGLFSYSRIRYICPKQQISNDRINNRDEYVFDENNQQIM